jgi:DNA (cytosine-5)-methyltransferase 1
MLQPQIRYAKIVREVISPTFLSLFAGAGGMALGLERAGLTCVGAVEKDEQTAETFRSNFQDRVEAPKLLALGSSDGDVRKIDFRDWARRLHAAGIERLDLLEGGPPCQAFSRVGRGKLNTIRKGGFLSDPRNLLWSHFFEAVRALRPRMFIVENVPGMLHHGGVNVAEAICRAGQNAGYAVKCAVLNAAAFGVPQTRERLFILGISKEFGVPPSFPVGDRAVVLGRSHYGAQPVREGLFEDSALFAGTLLPTAASSQSVGVQEAIGDLPPFLDHLESGYRARVPRLPQPYRRGAPSRYAQEMRSWPGFEAAGLIDHVCKATPRDYDTFAEMKPGDKYPEAVEIAKARYTVAMMVWRSGGERGRRPTKRDFIPPYKQTVFPDKWHKLFPDQPSWTITAHLAKDTYSHIHYDSDQKRMISVREAARLQSFPDGFQFSGNIGDRFRQIGNAVPPLLGYGVGVRLKSLLHAVRKAELSTSPKTVVAARQAATG